MAEMTQKEKEAKEKEAKRIKEARDKAKRDEERRQAAAALSPSGGAAARALTSRQRRIRARLRQD